MTIYNTTVNVHIKVFCEHMFSFLSGRYLEIELLGCMISIYLTFFFFFSIYSLFKKYQSVFQSDSSILHYQQQKMMIPVSQFLSMRFKSNNPHASTCDNPLWMAEPGVGLWPVRFLTWKFCQSGLMETYLEVLSLGKFDIKRE